MRFQGNKNVHFENINNLSKYLHDLGIKNNSFRHKKPVQNDKNIINILKCSMIEQIKKTERRKN